MKIMCDICNKTGANAYKSVYRDNRVITYCPDCQVGQYQAGAVGIDEGRKQDVLDITAKLQTTKNPKQRAQLQSTLSKIKNEPSKVRQMRQELIHEMKQGNADNVKDISEWAAKRSDYR